MTVEYLSNTVPGVRRAPRIEQHSGGGHWAIEIEAQPLIGQRQYNHARWLQNAVEGLQHTDQVRQMLTDMAGDQSVVLTEHLRDDQGVEWLTLPHGIHRFDALRRLIFIFFT
jgi:hypothetical protein